VSDARVELNSSDVLHHPFNLSESARAKRFIKQACMLDSITAKGAYLAAQIIPSNCIPDGVAEQKVLRLYCALGFFATCVAIVDMHFSHHQKGLMQLLNHASFWYGKRR